jgi:hypothetical protein
MKIVRSGTSARRRTVAALAAAGVAVGTAMTAHPTAQAAPAAVGSECPDAYPVGELVRDQPVTGSTVSSGTTPDEFDGTYLGVIEDGIAPDMDMIMVRLSSPEIDRVGGIWAGMSGSPVYAEDGRLIGAVSYGLSYGPSPVAGVTPAAEMRKLLSDRGSAAAPAGEVAIPERTQRRMVRQGHASSAEAEGGLSRLPLPLGVSVGAKRIRQASKLIGEQDYRVYKAGAVTASSTPTPIVAGGNLAASMSYGDLSAVGVGTATMVCGEEVVGFGHPFSWSGESTLTLHGADAVYVQEDPAWVSYKVANASAPVGIIDQDRLAGIKGAIGELPGTATVTTAVSTPSGAARTGTTEVSVQDFVPDAAAFGLLVNQDRVFDQIGDGSATVHYAISGVTAAGEDFTLERTNRYASDYDISFETIFELAGNAYTLLGNRFTDLTFTDVDVDVVMDSAARRFSVGKVEVRRGGAWHTLGKRDVVKARPGSTLRVRTTLTSYRNRFGSDRVVQRVAVPRMPVGTRGRLEVRGAGNQYYYEGGSARGADSFAALVDKLASAPRNDELSTRVQLYGPRRVVSRKKVSLADDVVQGRRDFRLRIVR